MVPAERRRVELQLEPYVSALVPGVLGERYLDEAVLPVQAYGGLEHRVGNDHDAAGFRLPGECDGRRHEEVAKPSPAGLPGYRHLGNLTLLRRVAKDGTSSLDLAAVEHKEDLAAGLEDRTFRVTEDLAVGGLQREVGLDPLAIELLECGSELFAVGHHHRT